MENDNAPALVLPTCLASLVLNPGAFQLMPMNWAALLLQSWILQGSNAMLFTYSNFFGQNHISEFSPHKCACVGKNIKSPPIPDLWCRAFCLICSPFSWRMVHNIKVWRLYFPYAAAVPSLAMVEGVDNEKVIIPSLYLFRKAKIWCSFNENWSVYSLQIILIAQSQPLEESLWMS